jgi:hypothetical protein
LSFSILFCYAQCHYAECRHADGRGARQAGVVKMKEFDLRKVGRSGRLVTVNNMGQYWQHFIFFATYGYE